MYGRAGRRGLVDDKKHCAQSSSPSFFFFFFFFESGSRFQLLGCVQTNKVSVGQINQLTTVSRLTVSLV